MSPASTGTRLSEAEKFQRLFRAVCPHQVGHLVEVSPSNLYASEWPGTYIVVGIRWEYQQGAGHDINITIASEDDIIHRYGCTDGWKPEDLIPAGRRAITEGDGGANAPHKEPSDVTDTPRTEYSASVTLLELLTEEQRQKIWPKKEGGMATMTLNLSDREMEVLTALADEQELSKTGVMRQSLRLYQLVIQRMKAGETMHFSGDKERIVEFIGPGFLGGDGGEAAHKISKDRVP